MPDVPNMTVCRHCGAPDTDHCRKQNCDWLADQDGEEVGIYPPGYSNGVQSTTDLAALERRVAMLEALATKSPARDVASLLGAKGCVCPAGAEATCKGFGCPRKETVVR